MQIVGATPLNPHQKWQFAVEIAGFDVAYFTECSGIEAENEKSVFKPAGSILDQKVAGRTLLSDVTLKKGKSQEGTDNSILSWQKQITDAAQNVGGKPSDYMRTVDIVEYDRTMTEIRRYRLFDAWVQKANLGEYEGGSSETTIEEVVICYNSFDQVV